MSEPVAARSEAILAEAIRDFYTGPGAMTDAAEYAHLFDELPPDVASLARVAQGLIVHEHLAPIYGLTLTDERRREVHTRPVQEMLRIITGLDDGPLSVERPVEKRMTGNCRHFSVLMVAMLRSKGVPARARCGFGCYFDGGFVDHWVCEYWDEGQSRWIMADAQLDARQRELFHSNFDVLDVPANQFVIAGEAWRRCRDGEADAAAFGIMELRGLWFIAGNLVRDVASLNNREMLPWDVWGAMPHPNETPPEDVLSFLDYVARLTRAGDVAFPTIRTLYEDDRIRLPGAIFNAILNRTEVVY